MMASKQNLAQRALAQVVIWLGGTLLWLAVYLGIDHVFAALEPSYQVKPEGLTIAIVGLWFALTLALRSVVAAWMAALFFAAAQWGQFLHYSYYGAPIAPHEPVLLFTEWREITVAFSGLLHHFWAALLLPLLPLAVFAAVRRMNRRFGVQGRWWPGMLFLALWLVLPLKAYRHPENTQAFYPRPYGYALKNAWLVTSYAIGATAAYGGISALAAAQSVSGEPYHVRPIGEGVDGVIVLVMGESTNPSVMSAFGNPQPTTPFLASLRTCPTCIVTIGQSAGVATKVTLPMFFNLQREPWRSDIPVTGKSNLISLAKQHGYRVVVESAQTNNLFTFTRADSADHFCTVDRCDPNRAEAGVDRVLLERIAAEPFRDKTLLILHTRVAHSAYDRYLPPGWQPFPVDTSSRSAQMQTTYRNAVAWFDELARQIVTAVRSKTDKPIWFILTGDHNELLGEGGRWGHGQLTAHAGEVPVVVAAWNGATIPEPWPSRLRCRPTHYELGQFVAELLGWEVYSPEESPRVLYTNGPDLGGKAGWIELTRRIAEDGRCDVVERLVPPGRHP